MSFSKLKYTGRILLFGGMCLILLSFVYDLVSSGIPGKDSMSSLQSVYEFHRMVARQIFGAGIALGVVGGLILLYRAFFRKKRNGSKVR